MIEERGSFQASTGTCLCGSIRYRIEGILRDVICCHCALCRRMSTHVGAYTECAFSDLAFENAETLRWFCATPHARRGFCTTCGSALFWQRISSDHISVAAGTLDQPTNLKLIGHICVAQKGDYYEIADELPQRR
jgi:hypothetical protein